MIIRFIKCKETNITNTEKICIINNYDIYFKDKKYKNEIDLDILDLFDYSKIDDEFIKFFREMNFELIFDKNISDFIIKIISKIKNFEMMEVIIGLINYENISEKNIFFDALNKKFDTLIKLINNITTVNNLNQIIKISAKIALMNFNFEKKEKNLILLKN